jgi:Flp pilus assembly protein TadG
MLFHSFRILKCTRAIVSLELALLFPVMWALLAGSVDIVLLIYTTFEVNNAASTAASIVSQLPSNSNYYESSITSVLKSINVASNPINVIGPITPIGTGQGAVIVTIVTQAASGPIQPMTAWQCTATALVPTPVSHVGTPTSTQAVNATLPLPASAPNSALPGKAFPAIVMDQPDAAVIVEAFYNYSPWVFGSGIFGIGVFHLYDETIFRFRGTSSIVSVPPVSPPASGNSAVAGTKGSKIITSTNGSC